MFSTTNAVLPDRPKGTRENRTKCFNLLLTPSEHRDLCDIADQYGLSRGGLCRLGLSGIFDQAKKDSTSKGKLPISADPFWKNFHLGLQ